MGFVWQSPRTLQFSNSLVATGGSRSLPRGMGAYLATKGVGSSRSFHFYIGSSASNNCALGQRNKEATVSNVNWDPSEKLTMTVGSNDDSDASNRRRIKVWLDDRLIYTYAMLVPGNHDNIWSYIGKGYPSNIDRPWNAAMPKFRTARWDN